MPGFDRNRIIGLSEQELQEFICGICLEVFIKPTVTECCGQTYCFDCINEWLAINNICPNDSKTLSRNQLKSADKIVSDLLSFMKIKCHFHESGCQSVVRISDLDKHTNIDCVYNPYRKCLKCGLAQLDHTDQLCNQELFRKFTEMSAKLDQTLAELEVEKLEDISSINELFNKIEINENKCNNQRMTSFNYNMSDSNCGEGPSTSGSLGRVGVTTNRRRIRRRRRPLNRRNDSGSVASNDCKQYSSEENEMFVGNLPKHYIESNLRDLFSKFGTILNVRIIRHNQKMATNNKQNYGFITFENSDIIQKILKQKPLYLCGYRFNVEQTRSQTRRGGSTSRD